MQNEKWKDVPGYEGLYEASDMGKVRNSGRYRGRILKPTVNGSGTESVDLWKDNKPIRRSVGNIVLRTFIGPPPPSHECCHGNRGRKCHELSNLSWGDKKKNLGEDRVRDGTSNRGERNGNGKLKRNDVLRIRVLIERGESQSRIARKFNVRQQTISDIKRGKFWSWLNEGVS